MVTSTFRVATRPRSFVGVRGPDAADYLERMVSNAVADLPAGGSCEALLLTAKARVIAPLRVLRRDEDDFLLLTEPDLGQRVRAELVRFRFAARVTVELEEHTSTVVFGDRVEGIPAPDYGEPAVEVLDGEPPGDPIDAAELELMRMRALTPAWGREIDERVLPAEAGLVERAVSFTKGCYPGQEPIARLHYRGHVNRSLRLISIDGDGEPSYDAEVRLGEKVVGRVTSAARDNGAILALGYVRRGVPDDAELVVEGRRARLH